MEEIKAACKEIADGFLKTAKTVEVGYFWKTLQSGLTGVTKPGYHESFYHGVAGIAYFLLEYANCMNSAQHGEIAGKSLKALCAEFRKSPGAINYAYYTGRMGVITTLYKAQADGYVTDIEDDIDFLSKGLDAFIENPPPVDDLINGKAGTLFSFLQCYSFSNDVAWITRAEKLLPALIKRAYFSEKGLYWDRSQHIIQGLCGLSHGVSGLAHVFLELFKVSKQPAFKSLAYAALAHERQYFRKEWNNWEDLRRSSLTERDVVKNASEYEKGNLDYFKKGSDMSAWCHGAAGIGLQRLHAKDYLTSYPFMEEEIDACLNRTIESEWEAATREMQILCHGAAGNCNLFVAAYNHTKNDKWLQLAQKTAVKIIAEKKKRGNYRCGYGTPSTTSDTSLFMGDAGVGWYYLRCLFPTDVSDILCPTFTGAIVEGSFSRFDLRNIADLVLEKYDCQVADTPETITLEGLKNVINEEDYQRILFDAKQESHALNFFRNKHRSEHRGAGVLKLAEHVCCFEKDESVQLQVSEGYQVKLFTLPDLAAVIVSDVIESPKTPMQLASGILVEHEIDESEKRAVQAAILQQIEQLQSAGFLWQED